MKKIVIILLLMPALSNAQSRNDRLSKDSLKYYERQLINLWKQAADSLRKSHEFLSLADKVNKHKRATNSYQSFVLFGDLIHSGFNKFNNSIGQSGFSKMDPYAFRAGIGMSSKADHTILDFYAVIVGFNNKAVKGDEVIKSSLTNFFQFDLGYDVLHSSSFSLYPYAGLSFRISALQYSRPEQLNTSYTNISDIVINDGNAYASALKLGYQAGMGLDVKVATNKDQSRKVFLFTKFGTNRPIGKEKYKIHDVKYRPEIKHADWLISFGVKFAKVG